MESRQVEGSAGTGRVRLPFLTSQGSSAAEQDFLLLCAGVFGIQGQPSQSPWRYSSEWSLVAVTVSPGTADCQGQRKQDAARFR